MDVHFFLLMPEPHGRMVGPKDQAKSGKDNLLSQEERRPPQISKNLRPWENSVVQFEIGTTTDQVSALCREFSDSLRDFLAVFFRTTQLTPSTSAAIPCKIFNDLKISEEQH